MIGKGAQYLTAAGFGRYRITAASLGSLDLLGTFSWLTAATKQAIMAAFGADGTAVIAATNDYLNGIAASDKAKATALAGFINEDPMMVCSLGLEPELTVLPSMPIRLACGDGSAWIDSGKKTTSTMTLDVEVMPNDNDISTSRYILGGNVAWGSFLLRYYVQKFMWHYGINGGDHGVGSPAVGNVYHITAGPYTIAVDGDSWTASNTKACAANENLRFYRSGNMTDLYAKSGIGKLIIGDNGINVLETYPFVRNNVIGRLDVLSNTFLTNQGSGAFTIIYKYKQNGSWVTWTPPTP